MKIKEVVVVEGKKDTARLKMFFDIDTYETSGSGLSKEDIEYLKVLNQRRGLIVFTDPDSPGEAIRSRISEVIPNVKHAFITAKEAREKKKTGVEHASEEVLIKALQNLITFQNEEETLSYSDYLDLGFSGKKESERLREWVAEYYHIGKCNAKTLWKRLNALGINKEEVQKVLDKNG